MGHLKRFFVVFFILLSVQILKAESPVSLYLKSIKIEGKTNINTFYFIYNNDSTEQSGVNKEFHSEEISFQIPVKAFKSSNQLMKEDFINLLKADEYPKIEVNIKKANLFRVAEDNAIEDLPIQLFLAGVNQKVSSVCYTDQFSNNQTLIEGFTLVNLEDFNLIPPKKLLGAIQVNDKILIKFDVVLANK
jgi:hypothetical protein